MKTAVITGSARGLGLEMAKVFKENDFNVVISDINEDNLIKSKQLLEKIKSKSNVGYQICDVRKKKDLISLIEYTKDEFNSIDIWINNAGVNQPNKAIWQLDDEQIDALIDIDLRSCIIASNLVINNAIKTGKSCAIYNIEGYGSNDAMMLGLSMYGTCKRAITYYTSALAKEVEERKLPVIVGKLSPGIMITDFITNALGDKDKIELSEKTKKVYNILGDYPDVVAKYLVSNMIVNTKNNAKIVWLTNGKAMYRFMTSAFNKRDFFNK